MAKKASEAQARRLADLWSGHGYGGISLKISREAVNSPTSLALLKNGWISPSGNVGVYPSGDAYEHHTLTQAGVDALESFLRDARQKRVLAADAWKATAS